jgi:putative acyl-CoA dehydrogenase
MAIVNERLSYETHEVTNQVPPLEEYNVYEQDTVLKEAINREGAEWAEDEISAFGAETGKAEFIDLGRLANKHVPELLSHDKYGNRIDEVEFHPSYHELMRVGIEKQIHALPWNNPRPGAHVARAAYHYLLDQVETGVGCPLTMTFAAVPALRHQPDVAEEWVPRITSTQYDPRMLPAVAKKGCMAGMAMTEKQGGSDVRANTTRAEPIGVPGPGQEYLLTGHKWFCSAPMCDVFLTLAQTDEGVTCFLVPRWRPDGSRNVFRVQRLKNKLGNRSNASSEIEYMNTWARMVGPEGRGVPTIIEMVNHTRLDCVIGTAAIMRQAVAQATHHANYRMTFGKLLREQPLMLNVLADLAIEVEASVTAMARLARAYDEAALDPAQRTFNRITTAVVKYWVCKRAPRLVSEALECHGGNGYVEEGIMARLYREAPLGSIWEGSGNVMALDVLRAMGREPETVDAFLAELYRCKGADKRLDRYVQKLEGELRNPENIETRARRIVEQMALSLQGSLLVRHAPHFVADAFVQSRLEESRGEEYGTLPADTDFQAIYDRACPRLD